MTYDAEKWKAAQRAGYTVYVRKTHVGTAWDIGWPGKTPMEGSLYKSAQVAAEVAVNRYVAEVQRAEALLRWREERWPWHHTSTGTWLEEHRFYAFADDGMLHHSAGYATAEQGIGAVTCDLQTHELSNYASTNPADLGCVCACIITGRQYVDQLYQLTQGGADLYAYGHWSDK